MLASSHREINLRDKHDQGPFDLRSPMVATYIHFPQDENISFVEYIDNLILQIYQKISLDIWTQNIGRTKINKKTYSSIWKNSKNDRKIIIHILNCFNKKIDIYVEGYKRNDDI